SLLVAALEREGLVERIPDPQDGRAQIIRFTRKGQAASTRAREVVMGVEQEWNDHLGPELAGCLREALTKLREIADPYQ
ncbi:MAG: winged helix DNA-binding protein, partial [Rhodococcus sp.]|nr:winged helix DNA-binding protein [Rhodococcus sp. (in: high G+C Gram-positive bacteria)]